MRGMRCDIELVIHANHVRISNATRESALVTDGAAMRRRRRHGRAVTSCCAAAPPQSCATSLLASGKRTATSRWRAATSSWAVCVHRCTACSWCAPVLLDAPLCAWH